MSIKEKQSFQLADEAPLIFNMNGSRFRWDVFKMAYEMSHPKSMGRIIQVAETIIEWVNNEQKIKINY